MTIEISSSGAIFTVCINRPEKRNAVDGATAKALADAFRQFEQDDASRVAVLYGAGGHFCAGADLKAFATQQGANALQAGGDGPMGPTRMLLSKPVIAAISGHAVAGGLELALWCDLRVADRSAVFGVYCRRFGVPLVDGGSVRLPRLIGMSHALDMILTGRPVAADEALRIGLANRLFENGEALNAAQALASEIARFPQQCLRGDRASAYQQWGLPHSEAMHKEFEHGLRVVDSGEALAGAKAFSDGGGRHGVFE
ncbi:MAG: crotonase/enoyl-CoA hydratase family protein [Gammaproteobacteria bacterium]|nr:crotonase/enoyl-CoA hydratase family protein [Gammaproteobacteria bacterium]MBT8151614.1 crotonase/enoyl-CoA hydratase family protein [Gammaproteobacteria bacterium]NND38646.1 crotonase/enoyl-CoA hydratase family protein [Pseudomonadales bacterium]NNL11609.1 crotonase/enoyl-CoA hydratase family protein [Pseudomonadales bacterium]NNM11724.1 crotonase/enoyl-CoA hydratase family protein [Pseudomonadales bacterium]